MRGTLSGRAARRANARDLRKKGAGWTRSNRKGRMKRHPEPLAPVEENETETS
jgi:hypothetical protein